MTKRRRNRFSPGMDETIRRFSGQILTEGSHIPGKVPGRLSLKSQRHHAIKMMAQSLGVTGKFRNDYELWGAVHEKIKDGVQNTRDTILGDPWYLFATAKCGKGHPEHEQIAMVPSPSGGPIEQAEAEGMMDYLRHEAPLMTCEICRTRCHLCGGWRAQSSEPPSGCVPGGCPCQVEGVSFDMTRQSVYAEGRANAR